MRLKRKFGEYVVFTNVDEEDSVTYCDSEFRDLETLLGRITAETLGIDGKIESETNGLLTLNADEFPSASDLSDQAYVDSIFKTHSAPLVAMDRVDVLAKIDAEIRQCERWLAGEDENPGDLSGDGDYLGNPSVAGANPARMVFSDEIRSGGSVVDMVFESESSNPSEDVLIKARLLVPVFDDVEAYVVRHGRVIWDAVRNHCRTETPDQYDTCVIFCTNVDDVGFSVREEMVDVLCNVSGNLNNGTCVILASGMYPVISRNLEERKEIKPLPPSCDDMVTFADSITNQGTLVEVVYELKDRASEWKASLEVRMSVLVPGASYEDAEVILRRKADALKEAVLRKMREDAATDVDIQGMERLATIEYPVLDEEANPSFDALYLGKWNHVYIGGQAASSAQLTVVSWAVGTDIWIQGAFDTECNGY